jgi:hypothetical protein
MGSHVEGKVSVTECHTTVILALDHLLGVWFLQEPCHVCIDISLSNQFEDLLILGSELSAGRKTNSTWWSFFKWLCLSRTWLLFLLRALLFLFFLLLGSNIFLLGILSGQLIPLSLFNIRGF